MRKNKVPSIVYVAGLTTVTSVLWVAYLVFGLLRTPEKLNIPEKINNLDNVVLIYAGLACLAMKSDGTYWYFNPENRIPQLVSFE